jgi:hypothetical protein
MIRWVPHLIPLVLCSRCGILTHLKRASTVRGGKVCRACWREEGKARR